MKLYVRRRRASSAFRFAHRAARTVLPSTRSSRLNPFSVCHRWPYTRRYRAPSGFGRNRRATRPPNPAAALSRASVALF